MLRVLCSAWMQRLWPRNSFLRFCDGELVALEELLPGLREEEQFNTVLCDLASDVYRLTKFRGSSSGSKFRISDVAHYLRWRTSSKTSDETLAISELLNVNAGELAAALNTRISECKLSSSASRSSHPVSSSYPA